MERYKASSLLPICIAFVFTIPGIAQGFEGSLELGAGITRSRANIYELSDGFMKDSYFDMTGQARHLLLTTPLTDDLSVAIGCRDFGTTLSDDHYDTQTQRSKAYELQLDYAFYKRENLSLHAWAGIANWRSSLEERAVVQIDYTLYWSDKTVERTSGYTPKLGLGLSYRFTDRLSIGAKYDYYRKLGEGKVMIDRYSVLIGDFVGASTGHEPLEFSLDAFEITIGYRF